MGVVGALLADFSIKARLKLKMMCRLLAQNIAPLSARDECITSALIKSQIRYPAGLAR
jgi:hypothetical protein